jgi:hypothetical protein
MIVHPARGRRGHRASSIMQTPARLPLLGSVCRSYNLANGTSLTHFARCSDKDLTVRSDLQPKPRSHLECSVSD